MRLLSTSLALGLCAIVLAGCETSGGGYGGGGIYEGPVRNDRVVVIDRTPTYREPIRQPRPDPRIRDPRRYDDPRYAGRNGRYDGRDNRRDDGRYDRNDNRYDDRGMRRPPQRADPRRDPCAGQPGYDPRYDRCTR